MDKSNTSNYKLVERINELKKIQFNFFDTTVVFKSIDFKHAFEKKKMTMSNVHLLPFQKLSCTFEAKRAS